MVGVDGCKPGYTFQLVSAIAAGRGVMFIEHREIHQSSDVLAAGLGPVRVTGEPRPPSAVESTP